MVIARCTGVEQCLEMLSSSSAAVSPAIQFLDPLETEKERGHQEEAKNRYPGRLSPSGTQVRDMTPANQLRRPGNPLDERSMIGVSPGDRGSCIAPFGAVGASTDGRNLLRKEAIEEHPDSSKQIWSAYPKRLALLWALPRSARQVLQPGQGLCARRVVEWVRARGANGGV